MARVLRDVEREFGPADAPTRFRLQLSLTDEWPPIPSISTAHCLAFDGEQVVLARHVTRQWTIPGGHVEAGESVDAALRRETLEEAGATIGVAELIAVERIERLSGPALSDRYTDPAFQAFFVAPLLALGPPTALDECTESRRFPPDEARRAAGWVQDNTELYEAALVWARGHAR